MTSLVKSAREYSIILGREKGPGLYEVTLCVVLVIGLPDFPIVDESTAYRESMAIRGNTIGVELVGEQGDRNTF